MARTAVIATASWPPATPGRSVGSLPMRQLETQRRRSVDDDPDEELAVEDEVPLGDVGDRPVLLGDEHGFAVAVRPSTTRSGRRRMPAGSVPQRDLDVVGRRSRSGPRRRISSTAEAEHVGGRRRATARTGWRPRGTSPSRCVISSGCLPMPMRSTSISRAETPRQSTNSCTVIRSTRCDSAVS